MPPILPENLVPGQMYVVSNLQFQKTMKFTGRKQRIGNIMLFDFLTPSVRNPYVLVNEMIDPETTRFFNIDDPDIPPSLPKLPPRQPRPPPYLSRLSPNAPAWSPPTPSPPTQGASPNDGIVNNATTAYRSGIDNRSIHQQEAMNAYKNPAGGRRSYFRLKKRKTKSKKSKKTIKRRR